METATSPPDATTTILATDAPPVDGAPLGEEEKKEGENPDDEELEPRELNEMFEYLDPRIYTPECTLKIQLIGP